LDNVRTPIRQWLDGRIALEWLAVVKDWYTIDRPRSSAA
jgi:hypothetical protein